MSESLDWYKAKIQAEQGEAKTALQFKQAKLMLQVGMIDSARVTLEETDIDS